MGMRGVLVVAAAAALVSSGCGGAAEVEEPAPQAEQTADPQRSDCEAAVISAAGFGGNRDTQADLWPAFDACASLEEFTAAVEENPDALNGVDPQTYVQDQCEQAPEVEGTLLCQEVSG